MKRVTVLFRKIFTVRRGHFTKHRETARKIIHARLQYWAPLCGVRYKRVAIRNQRRRWGSCSSLGNLNFNYKLVFLPSDICDYVIVHELCHLKQMNHGPHFWNEVEKVLPDYQRLVVELRKIEKGGIASLEKNTAEKFNSTYFDSFTNKAVVIRG